MAAKDLVVASGIAFVSVAACSFCGCGSTAGGSPNPTLSDVATDAQLAADIQSGVSSYRSTMSATSAATECQSIHDHYDATVRPSIERVVLLAAEMDGYIDARYADMRCTSASLLAELDFHRTMACTFSTLADDQNEALRHASAMMGYASHVSSRCSEIMKGGPSGSMMTGCAPGSAAPSNDPSALGARIFYSGIGHDGTAIPHTSSSLCWGMNTCATCHGADGHGRRMMMFTAPNITYANLTDSAGMLEPDGTRGATYTDALIRRAIVQGVGADGDPLDTRMPRWQLDDTDWVNLLAFFETLR